MQNPCSQFLLTIVIPVYNTEQYIPSALGSVLHQLTEETELIIFDDGSTDNSLETTKTVIANTRHPAISLISQPHGGLSNVRNNGIRLARGKYILFFDSDDILYDFSIESILRCINQMDDDVITFNYNVMTEKGRLIGMRVNSTHETDMMAIPNVFSNAWRYLCKKDFIIDNDLFFIENTLCEDIDWSVRLHLASPKIYRLDATVYEYKRNRPGSIMASISEERLSDAINNIHRSILFSLTDQVVDVDRMKIIASVLADQLYFNMAQIPQLAPQDRQRVFSAAQACFDSFEHLCRPKDIFVGTLGVTLSSYSFYFVRNLKRSFEIFGFNHG